MKQLFTHVIIVFILSLGFVFAHSEFESSVPEDGSLLSEAPKEIVLNFKADIQPGFSIFKVYALPADMLTESTSENSDHGHDDSHSDGDSSSEEHSENEHSESGDHGAMDTAAKIFIPSVIDLQGDEEARADNGLATTENLAKSVTITLKENLAPGAYVVMFRALSADTHMIEGFITFEVSE